MSSRDLCRNPVWQGGELGRPLPDSTHAVSMALPRWQDVVGYEEKRPEVMTRLASGYPRFVIHPLVGESGRRLGKDRPCLPFPSAGAANAAAQYVRRSSGEEAIVCREGTAAGVVTRGGRSGVAGLLAARGLNRLKPGGGGAPGGEARLAPADDVAVRRPCGSKWRLFMIAGRTMCFWRPAAWRPNTPRCRLSCAGGPGGGRRSWAFRTWTR